MPAAALPGMLHGLNFSQPSRSTRGALRLAFAPRPFAGKARNLLSPRPVWQFAEP